MISYYDNLVRLKALTEAVSEQESEQLDPEHYAAYAKAPSDLDEETLNQIVDIIDGKNKINPKPDYVINEVAPATIDRVLNSESIIYITEDDIPVGVVTLVDPTAESYQGYIPLDLFGMYSATNLDGRLMQEFFAVDDTTDKNAVSKELRGQIANLGVHTFTIADKSDVDTIAELQGNGYKMLCEMPLDTEKEPVTIWLDDNPDDNQDELD